MTVGEEGRDSRHIIWQREYVSEETVMLRRWFEGGGGGGKEFQDNLVITAQLILQVGHWKELLELTFRALALRQSESLHSVLYVEYYI